MSNSTPEKLSCDDSLRRPWWFSEIEIIKDYLPPNPLQKGPREPKRTVIRHVPSRSFLRHSCGPRQGHFWDCYGDDYLDENLALLSVMQAPPPPRAAPPWDTRALEILEREISRLIRENKGLADIIAARDDTVDSLRELLAGIHDTVRVHGRPRDY